MTEKGNGNGHDDARAGFGFSLRRAFGVTTDEDNDLDKLIHHVDEADVRSHVRKAFEEEEGRRDHNFTTQVQRVLKNIDEFVQGVTHGRTSL